MLQGAEEQAELQAAPWQEQAAAHGAQQLGAGAQAAQPLPQGAAQLGLQLFPQPLPQPPHGAAQLGPQGAAQLLAGQQLLCE